MTTEKYDDLIGIDWIEFGTVVGDNMNKMKTTFLFKFLLLTSFFGITSLQVIKEKLFIDSIFLDDD